MNYTLHQLQIFLKIAETESITKAAESMHLTQPAVSIQLKKLQEQFNIPLVEVIGKKIHLTHAGKALAVSAADVIEKAQMMNQQMKALKGELAGKLSISVVSTGKYVIPYFLHNFLQQHPEVDLQMDVTNKVQVIESLKQGSVDFALVSMIPTEPPIQKISLMPNKLVLVASQSLEESYRKGKKELHELPFIYREQGSATRYVMEAFLEKRKITAVKKIELTGNEAVKQAVIAGLGYSVMPIIGLKNELQLKELKIITVKGLPIISTWNLIWLKRKQLHPTASTFIQYVKTHKQRIMDQHFSWYDEIKL
ncbi:MAG: LysR family transcriptional regulator [Bacteroidia bacterium]|jgi:DNA-binding transcriptional LysR family regulator|nr:LysR family transcriptional regulator [Bacteroidia bacterium]